VRPNKTNLLVAHFIATILVCFFSGASFHLTRQSILVLALRSIVPLFG
jgi:hypothetical protein